MATLTSTIDADDETIAVSGDVSAAVRGALYSLDDEIIVLRSFGRTHQVPTRAPSGYIDRHVWIVTRGAEGSTPTSHSAGTDVVGVSDAFVAGVALPAPEPLSAVSVAETLSILPPSNGVDDTAVINAILEASRLTFKPATVKGLAGETYLVTTLVVGSYTTLDMTGCLVQQITGTDTNMLRNWAFDGEGHRTIQDAAITAGGTTLTSATANFQASEDENNVRIWGAGKGGEVWANTIQSVTNSTTVELYDQAPTTVTDGQATIGQWDIDITIFGGIWDRGDNGRLHQYEPGHEGDEDFRIQDASGFGMLLRRCDRVTVRDITFRGGNADTCTAICFGDATNFLADNIRSDTYVSGLVQATGPCRHGRFSNIYSYHTTDDLVQLLSVDWLTGVRDIWGDIAYLVIDNVHSEWCDGSLVLVTPGSASLGISTEHIYIRNVHGMDTNLTQNQGGLVWLADSGAYPDMAGGFLDDIAVEDVSGEPMGTSDRSRCLVYLKSPNAGKIRLSGLNIHTPTGSTRHGIILGEDSDIGYLTVTDSVISSIDGGCDLINYDIASGSVIQNLSISRCALRENGVWTILESADAPTYAETVLAIPDLELYWRLGEAVGPTAADASPANLDGTYNNGTLGASGLIANDVDTAWTGNGTDSSISGPTIPAMANWTILWWQKSNGANADFSGIFTTPGDRIDIARVTAGSTGQLYIYAGGSWGGPSDWTVDASPTMLAASYDGVEIALFKNGVKLAYTTAGRSLLNATFDVGVLGGTETIDTLDEFAIFSRALDEAEVAMIYSRGS